MARPRSFGQKVQHYRNALDLTQAALARHVGCSASTIKKIEGDQRRPSVSTARRLADAFQLAGDDRTAFLRAARMPVGSVSPPLPPTNLPSPHTSFVGRAQESEVIRSLLLDDKVRLLTLTGAGGIGKTRLALHVAADLRAAFAQGVLFVPLAALREPDHLLTAIAHTLGLRETGHQSLIEDLTTALHEQHLLLLLDNFEHLLATVPHIVTLLARTTRLKLLITSRARLNVPGEHEYPVPPLALPNLRRLPPHYVLAKVPAVALFLTRAQAVHPDFQCTEANAGTLAAICIQSDGIPLALEIAAVHTRVLAPVELLERLRDHRTLLVGGLRGAAERHRSVQALIAWSVDLLDTQAQALFTCLSVFVGGCTLEAAENVCTGLSSRSSASADVDVAHDLAIMLVGVETLLENNLLAQENGADGTPRLVMLEMVRAYALHQLEASGSAEIVRRRYADYYVALVEQASPALRGQEQAAWLKRLEDEYPNVRAVLAWAHQQGNGELLGRMSAAFWRFWLIRDYIREGVLWLELILTHYESSLPIGIRAQIYQGAGALVWTQGDLERAKTYFGHQLALAQAVNDTPTIAQAFNDLGLVAYSKEDYDQAVSYLEASLPLMQALEDKDGMATTLSRLGNVAAERGEYARAEQLFTQSLALSRELRDQRRIALALNSLGYILRRQGDPLQAIPIIEESLHVHRELGSRLGEAFALLELGGIMLNLGAIADAREYLIRGMTLFREIGQLERVVECLENLADTAARELQFLWVARLGGAAAALRQRIGRPMPPYDEPDYTQTLTAAQAQVSQGAWTAAWAEGQAQPLDQMIADLLTMQEIPPSA
jgi:predicted ATPase/DNA-binding XRE family transcriptional regulator